MAKEYTAARIAECLRDPEWLYSMARRVASKVIRPKNLDPLDVQHDAIEEFLKLAPKYPKARATYLTTTLEPWLIKTVRGLLANKYRADHAWSKGRVDLTDDPLVPEELFDVETVVTFQGFIKRLTPRRLQSIVRESYDGVPVGKIAFARGVTASTIRVDLADAKALMRAMWLESHPEDAEALIPLEG